MQQVQLSDGRHFVLPDDDHLLVLSFADAVSVEDWDAARWRGVVAAQVLLEVTNAQSRATWQQAAADFDNARRGHRSWDVPLLERFPQLAV